MNVKIYHTVRKASMSTYPLTLRFVRDSMRFEIATGVKVPKGCWNQTRQIIVNHPEAKRLNARVKAFKKEFEINEAELNDINKDYTFNELRQLINVKQKNKNVGIGSSIPTRLFPFIQYFIDVEKKTAAKISRYDYKRLQSFLKDNYSSYDWRDLNRVFFNDFQERLQEEGYRLNYVGKFIKDLKTVINAAKRHRIPAAVYVDTADFKKLSEETTAIYLNEKELTALSELKLQGREELARDLFLVGCWTGLRYVNYSNLMKQNIQGEVLKVKTAKGGGEVIIPILEELKPILNKYDGFPPTMANQELNDLLPSIGEAAGINQMISETFTKGGKETTIHTEKYNLMKTHTARRSFATNAYLRDVPAITIMKITGHKKESTFLTYLKMDKLTNAELFKKTWNAK